MKISNLCALGSLLGGRGRGWGRSLLAIFALAVTHALPAGQVVFMCEPFNDLNGLGQDQHDAKAMFWYGPAPVGSSQYGAVAVYNGTAMTLELKDGVTYGVQFQIVGYGGQTAVVTSSFTPQYGRIVTLDGWGTINASNFIQAHLDVLPYDDVAQTPNAVNVFGLVVPFMLLAVIGGGIFYGYATIIRVFEHTGSLRE